MSNRKNINKWILGVSGGLLALFIVIGMVASGSEQPATAPTNSQTAKVATQTPAKKSRPAQSRTATIDPQMKTAIDAQARDKACDMLQFQLDKQKRAGSQETVNYITLKKAQAGCK